MNANKILTNGVWYNYDQEGNGGYRLWKVKKKNNEEFVEEKTISEWGEEDN